MIQAENNLRDLPKGWIWTKLADLVNIVYGKNLPVKKLLPEGYPVFGANGIIGYYDNYLYESEQVLLSCRGAYSGTINYSTPRCFVTNNSLVLELSDSCSDIKRYLFYALKVSDKSKLITGTAQPQVTINNAVELSIPLPPLAEQKRIVAKIEELFTKLDAGVEALKKVRQELKRYSQAVLKHAFEGKLTEQWREAHKGKLEPASKLLERIQKEREKTAKGKAKKLSLLDKSKLPKLPEGWEWATMESVCEIVSGVAFKSRDFCKEGVPVLKIANISYGAFVGKQQEYLPKSFLEEYQNYHVYPETVLLALTRPITNNTIKACLYPSNYPPSLLNQRVAKLREYDFYDKRFLLYLLRSEFFKRQVRIACSETLQPNLSPLALKRFPVPFLLVSEQKQVVAEIEHHFSIADEIEQTIEQSLKQSNRLRQSILKKAFEGKLVPQDPNDEPAEKLLERIKAEKEKLKKKPKCKRN